MALLREVSELPAAPLVLHVGLWRLRRGGGTLFFATADEGGRAPSPPRAALAWVPEPRSSVD